MRSSTFRKTAEKPILEQQELDYDANYKEGEEGETKNARSEFDYKPGGHKDDVLDDAEAQKLLSEYEKQMAKGDYTRIDDDVVSVISQKIPMLNKQRSFVPQVLDDQVLLETE